jgi:hypothetical protein
VAGAFAAAAVRRRDALWAVFAGLLVLLVPVAIARSGLDSTFITDADNVAIIVGAFLMAGAVTFGLGLPKSLEDRLPSRRQAAGVDFRSGHHPGASALHCCRLGR